MSSRCLGKHSWDMRLESLATKKIYIDVKRAEKEIMKEKEGGHVPLISTERIKFFIFNLYFLLYIKLYKTCCPHTSMMWDM